MKSALNQAANLQSNFRPPASQLQRKTLLRRFGSGLNAKKIAETKQLPTINCVQASVDDRRKNEATESLKPVMDVTKTINPANILTRSSTFVCDTGDETQAKLLSLTHNINTPTPSIQITQQQSLKERTSKRSLSPIFGDAINLAKRKSIQTPSVMNRKLDAAQLIVSTPKHPETSGSKVNFPPFFASDDGLRAPLSVSANTNAYSPNDTICMMNENKDPIESTVKECDVVSAAMQSNRLNDLTRTIGSNCASGDTFTKTIREKQDTTQSLSVIREQGAQDYDALKSVGVSGEKLGSDSVGTDLTRTLNGKLACFGFYVIHD